MTTFIHSKHICAVCGTEHEFPVLTSTNSFGSPDLDLRPPEMRRSTMDYWVQECPECGYVAEDIGAPTEVTKAFLESDDYLNCGGNKLVSQLAQRFYKLYMINLQTHNVEGAFFAILHAAWACDDKEDCDNAKSCRELAAQKAEQLIRGNEDNAENYLLMKADLLRRSGQFNELLEEYKGVRFSTEIMNQVLAFQLVKAAERDPACYTVEEAIKYMKG